MVYEDFLQEAGRVSGSLRADGRRVPIPELRRAMGHVPPAAFDHHLLRMERNGVVYLASGDARDGTPEDEGGVLRHPAGGTRCCLLWIRRRLLRSPVPD
jgi:hypothetical protein